MDNKEINQGRRRFLTLATAGAGGVAAVGVAAPFLASWFPSEKAKAAGAPIEVDISKIEAGQLMTVEWQGKPIWVLNRTEAQQKSIPAQDGEMADPSSDVDHQPEYCKNELRSIKDNIFVVIGICTHLGCSPTFRPDVAPADLGASWQGGFFCPCHGSKFDLAGRVFKGVPAPTNLIVPPYKYLTDATILVGDDK
ncbi:ubiquinol-cytochrome c reductase iron-sulfur subunit [Uruburuella suis]|jgi:ubiquinol-cytochrome c reductase iron-sulfur subunit|uniref:Ubiquinol-cytochrome c reductase iron-sulfur subunit n=1 Tax=Uruburuella suis TaxID=252130 RepID=A0AAE9H0Y8_9NEIS|nr:ubiquinol-cytochrome c reductase iron-sulfur subunit [Uruburuella suis]MBP6393024.1 ubiquinol-cytochrome c reductase iron-sulfur subunit [Neisseria sp.]MBP8042977.1 ubiquinol-cytochrome c reductase iron-sulfur subunit [Neisseria sp.]MBP8045471.1 ubiquinol-cytochrome c reductase iron-sulfur subunit [Neisseria sp.]MBP8069469.1 ubiquinol-cytochrome c reductase iron-sulfur subunit [Neisseria sp.]MBP8876133.1 ubiquinol-cytochrome c reductase iron-sulfur subunit [Neisseria sp.]